MPFLIDRHDADTPTTRTTPDTWGMAHGQDSARAYQARLAQWILLITTGCGGMGTCSLISLLASDADGITIAQKLDTASQPDMPESAIDTGCIDFVLSPEDIAREIVRIAQGEAKVA